MLTHRQIWSAIDRLAELNNMSTSRLAVKGGLDPTSFNKSKRITKEGRKRWPSTESVAKVLKVAKMSFEDFGAFAAKKNAHGPSVPVVGLAQAGSDGFFTDAGYPVGEGWDEVRVPGIKDGNIYALEISGDSMSPALRHGDRVLVAPSEEVRKGDRVVLKTVEGEVMAKELTKYTKTLVEVASVNPDYENHSFKRKDIQWIARIVWASQ